MNRNNLLETVKKPYLVIVLIILTLLFFSLGEILVRTNKKVCQDFDEDRSSIDNFVCIEIENPPIMFKVTPNGGKEQLFYIVSNSSEQYLVKLPLYLHNDIMEEYEKDKENFKYKIEGTTYKIYDSLKRASIKTYNKEFNENIINFTNYNEYFGHTYIDSGESPTIIIRVIFYLIGTFFLIISVAVIIAYINTRKNLKLAIKKYGKEELERQLNDSKTISYPKPGIYLTDKYIISNSTDFKVVPYQDIYWMYILKKKTNGITVGTYLTVCTKNKKTLLLAYMYKDKILIEIMQRIYEKNNSILLDYTNENLKKYKEFIKNRKKEM